MCECHDIYDAVTVAPAAAGHIEGSQCHDFYEAAGADRSAAVSTRLPGHECRIVDTRRGPVRVVRVVGKLDWATEAQFCDFMRDGCTSPAVVINLSDADEDAAGTGVLLAATARARKRGQQLVFVVPHGLERKVLLSMGLNEVAPLMTTETEALAWFDAHGPVGVDSAAGHGLGT